MAYFEKRVGKKGKTTWKAQVRMMGEKTLTKSFEKKSDAEDWARETEYKLKRGLLASTGRGKTLSEAIDRYSVHYLPQMRSKLDRALHLRFWGEQLGRVELARVTPALITEKRDLLVSEGKSNATVNRYLAALSHLLTTCMKEWGWITSNPCSRVSKLKEPKGRVRFLTNEERDRLLSVCSEDEDLYLAVILALSTGARRGEIWGLRWKQIDLLNEHIVLDVTKNGETRAVPIQGKALELLRNRATLRRIDTDLLFPSNLDPQEPFDFRRGWERAIRKAEIKDFRWHDLRHTAASWLAMNGATLPEIAAILGHKTLSVVQRYAHISEQHTKGVMRRMVEDKLG